MLSHEHMKILYFLMEHTIVHMFYNSSNQIKNALQKSTLPYTNIVLIEKYIKYSIYYLSDTIFGSLENFAWLCKLFGHNEIAKTEKSNSLS